MSDSSIQTVLTAPHIQSIGIFPIFLTLLLEFTRISGETAARSTVCGPDIANMGSRDSVIDTTEEEKRDGVVREIVMRLPKGSNLERFRKLFYRLCTLSLALAVILAVVLADPASAGELKIYSSEGVKRVETPGAPADDGGGSPPLYRYAGERCLSNCEAAAETAPPHEKQSGKVPIPRPKAPATNRSCFT